MEQLHLDRAQILQNFDSLRVRGALHWSESAQIVKVVDDGFPFEFRITAAFTSKPWKIDSSHLLTNPLENSPILAPLPNPFSTPQKATPSPSAPPTPPPPPTGVQSDIANSEPGFDLGDIHATHRLVLNKFCVFRPQYLLLTADPAEKQTSALETADFRAAWTVLRVLGGKHYAFFNCGTAAGCSRMHKHLQVFERVHEELLPETLLKGKSSVKIPYQYSLDRITLPASTSPDEAAQTYTQTYHRHLQQAEAALSPYVASGECGPQLAHNVIFTEKWIMTIPRRQMGLGDATANAAGLIGMVWVSKGEIVELWKMLGPRNVLEAIGVPSGEEVVAVAGEGEGEGNMEA